MKQLAQELRNALNVRDLTRARELLLAYRSEFDRVWSGMTEPERAQSSMPGEAVELLNWARTMAVLAKKDFDVNNRSLHGASKYLGRQRSATVYAISR